MNGENVKVFFQFLLASSFFCQLARAEKSSIEVNLPNVLPYRDNIYMCYSVKLEAHEQFISCEEPGIGPTENENELWDCSKDGGPKSSLRRARNCNGRTTRYMFSSAKDAVGFQLPPNVGMKISGNSSIKYLVLSVHFSLVNEFNSQNPKEGDFPGMTVSTLSGSDASVITKHAGIYYNAGGGIVPPGLHKHIVQCPIVSRKPLHPFRYRIHTHSLGYEVAGYKVPMYEPQNLILIGKRNPQDVQSYYPVENEETNILYPGDKLFSYCKFNNTRNMPVPYGKAHTNEMCIFYLMFWTDGEIPDYNGCSWINYS